MREEPARKPRPKAQKSFDISKWAVKQAYEKVKANAGAAGVDEMSLQRFEVDLKANLSKIWNRMSSGTYFPPPVLAVEIPKKQGGVRILGVPTVSDRIAQTVVAMYLEPKVESIFHPDSYGYRPGRSALDAVAACRKRCQKIDWVIDLDIGAFFDSIDHDLLLKAVSKHTDLAWVLLYIRRWLNAPLQRKDGTLVERDRGTPQGSAISPLLANLFLHYAFDTWMAREYPDILFERYADDAVVHCVNKGQAKRLLVAISERLARCGLELHPDKTRIVYCKDETRKGQHDHTSFDFLGFTFRRRGAAIRRARSSMALSLPSVIPPPRPYVSRYDAGTFTNAVTCRSWTSHARSIPPCGAGLRTTAASTGRGCTTNPSGASMHTWCAGPNGNTSDFATTHVGHGPG